jgi:hypothetical protein
MKSHQAYENTTLANRAAMSFEACRDNLPTKHYSQDISSGALDFQVLAC